MRSLVPNQRFLVAVGIMVLLSVALLVLNAFTISSTWFNAAGLLLTALGVIATLDQWLRGFGVSIDRELDIFRRQIEHDLNKRLGKGALIVFTTDQEVALYVNLVPQRFWKCSSSARSPLRATRKELVKRHRVGTGCVCAVIFRDIDPDDYLIWFDGKQPTSVSVFSNEAATVDWR